MNMEVLRKTYAVLLESQLIEGLFLHSSDLTFTEVPLSGFLQVCYHLPDSYSVHHMTVMILNLGVVEYKQYINP